MRSLFSTENAECLGIILLVGGVAAAIIARLLGSKTTDIGVFAWGAATTWLAVYILILAMTGEPSSKYERLIAAAPIVGGIVAASTLAWSLFYKEATDSSLREEFKALERKVVQLEKKYAAKEAP